MTPGNCEMSVGKLVTKMELESKDSTQDTRVECINYVLRIHKM